VLRGERKSAGKKRRSWGTAVVAGEGHGEMIVKSAGMEGKLINRKKKKVHGVVRRELKRRGKKIIQVPRKEEKSLEGEGFKQRA